MEQKKLEELDEIKDGKTDFISSVNSFSKYVIKEINADIGNKSFFVIAREGDQFACANICSAREREYDTDNQRDYLYKSA